MAGIRIYLQHIISLIFQTNSPIMEWNDDSALPAAAAEPLPQVDVSVTFYRIHIMNVVSQRNHVVFFFMLSSVWANYFAGYTIHAGTHCQPQMTAMITTTNGKTRKTLWFFFFGWIFRMEIANEQTIWPFFIFHFCGFVIKAMSIRVADMRTRPNSNQVIFFFIAVKRIRKAHCRIINGPLKTREVSVRVRFVGRLGARGSGLQERDNELVVHMVQYGVLRIRIYLVKDSEINVERNRYARKSPLQILILQKYQKSFEDSYLIQTFLRE